MTAGEDDEPPTFSRPPPEPGRRISDQQIPSIAFSVAPNRAPVFSAVDMGPVAIGSAKEEDDDGPPTDVDDGPPTFSIAPAGPGREVGDVTLVNAAPPHERLQARVVTADATHLFVKVEGEPAARRISRSKCFEHPVGGGWSTWRLSGADRERWMVEVAAQVGDGSA
jgi:hypothetical protein